MLSRVAMQLLPHTDDLIELVVQKYVVHNIDKNTIELIANIKTQHVHQRLSFSLNICTQVPIEKGLFPRNILMYLMFGNSHIANLIFIRLAFTDSVHLPPIIIGVLWL